MDVTHPITLLTGGQDHDLCHVLLTEQWTSKRDMCPNVARWWVERNELSTGVRMGDVFTPALVMSRVCDVHAGELLTDPLLREIRPLAD